MPRRKTGRYATFLIYKPAALLWIAAFKLGFLHSSLLWTVLYTICAKYFLYGQGLNAEIHS